MITKEDINMKYEHTNEISCTSEYELKQYFLIAHHDIKNILHSLDKEIKKEHMDLIFEVMSASQVLAKYEFALASKLSKEEYCEFTINVFGDGETNGDSK